MIRRTLPQIHTIWAWFGMLSPVWRLSHLFRPSPFGKRLRLLPAPESTSCTKLHQRQNRPWKLPAACCKVIDVLQQASRSCGSYTRALPDVHAAFLLQHRMKAAQATQGHGAPPKNCFLGGQQHCLELWLVRLDPQRTQTVADGADFSFSFDSFYDFVREILIAR